MTWRRVAVVMLLSLCAARARAGQTSSIALSPDESTVAAVAQDADGVSLWHWPGDGPPRLVSVGQEPRTATFTPDGRALWVTCQTSQTLEAVDVKAGKAVARIPLSGQPYGLVLTPDGRRAFVSQYAGGYADGHYHPGIVAVVDLETRRTVARIPVKARPWAMALDAVGRSLYVTHFLNLGGQGWVTVIDTQNLCIVHEIPLREDENVRDGQGGVFNGLAAIALHPNLPRALVGGMHANVRRGGTLNGQQLSHKTTVQAAVRVLDMSAAQELYEARIVSSFSGQAVAVPSAVAFVGTNDFYLDVYFASSDFKILQYNERGLVAERALHSLPAGPTGVAITRDGQNAFFNCRWDRSVAHFSLADVREPTLVRTIRICGEPWDEQRLRGAILFHNTRDSRMTANRWMSCAVCHLDGAIVSDGLVWDLTTPGGRSKIGNTMDLINLHCSTPPYFHRGSTNVVEDLQRFVQVFNQGSGFEAPDWAAILTFADNLRARPNPHMEGNRPRPEIRASAERGRKLFFDPARQCAQCHAGPALTVSGKGGPSVFDVGTGKPVNTPPLLDLWDTAPYLHDGRAATLVEVLTTHNREDRHGRTSDLNAQQLDDLVNYVLAPFSENKP